MLRTYLVTQIFRMLVLKVNPTFMKPDSKD